MPKIEVNQSSVRTKCLKLLANAGIPAADAELLVDSLIDAEVKGVESHGLMRLPAFLDRIEKGLMTPVPQIRTTRLADNIFAVDGDNGLGQIIAIKALDTCVKEAKNSGLAVAAIKNTNHLGTTGYYSRRAAKEGLLALVATNASATMPPYGGLKSFLGTNPFAVSFPAGKYDAFTIDIAMSAVARGKIRIFEKEGKAIPIGWAMDAAGNDTTDPTLAIEGGLLPMGAHKGYGLAMVVDVLCGILSGAKLSCDIDSMFNANQVSGVGHFIAVMDITRFLPLPTFVGLVENWFDKIKASELRPGFSEIFIPGEIEIRREAEATEVIHVLDKTIQTIDSLAERNGNG